MTLVLSVTKQPKSRQTHKKGEEKTECYFTWKNILRNGRLGMWLGDRIVVHIMWMRKTIQGSEADSARPGEGNKVLDAFSRRVIK